MPSRRSWIPAIAGLAAVAAAWAVLGPIELGGSVGYATIVGSSMEPKLHRGDLVLVRRGAEYRVGDVVAYRNRALKRTVLHRIVAENSGGYVLKGDANDFLDPGQVKRSDVIGGYWLKIGGAGRILGWVLVPWHAALLAGLLGVLLVGGTGATVRRRRHGHRQRDRSPPLPVGAPSWNRFVSSPTTVVAGLLLLVFVLLGALALALPSQRQVMTDRLYVQTGTFSYGGGAPTGTVYPEGRVGSGEAVFTQLVHRLRVGFEWRLETQEPHEVHGRGSLAVELSDGSGWTRRLMLVAPTPFLGDRTAVSGVLYLGVLERLLRRFEQATGTHAGAYQVRLVPTVEVAGSVAGRAVNETFSPQLQLTLDELRLQLVQSLDPSQPNSLSREELFAGEVVRPNEISFLGRHLALPTAKRTAVIGGGLSLTALLLLFFVAMRRPAADEAVRRRSLQSRWIVDLAKEPTLEHVLDVAQFDELVRLAERYDRLILHHEPTGVFVLEEDGVAYRWRATQEPPSERRHPDARPWAATPEDPPATVETQA